MYVYAYAMYVYAYTNCTQLMRSPYLAASSSSTMYVYAHANFTQLIRPLCMCMHILTLLNLYMRPYCFCMCRAHT